MAVKTAPVCGSTAVSAKLKSHLLGTVIAGDASSPKVVRRSSPSRRQAAVKMPVWFKEPELASALEQSENQRLDLSKATEQEIANRVKVVLKQELGFISNPAFSDPKMVKKIFATPLQLAPAERSSALSTVRKAGEDLPVHLSRLCEAKLLTQEQESTLFQRMNFLRHQAAMHRAALSIETPSAARLELIHQLLVMADWHRDRIVEANTRLVFSIVKKFINASNSFDDLLSDGIVGLMRAVEKFDYDRGFRFSTYATQVVRRNAYRQVVEKQQDGMKVMSGMDDLDLDIADEERGSTMSEGRWNELRSRLGLMLGDLDRREKFIIRARFSLGSHRRVQTLQALADRLGVSKERVRQLERRAMEKLRAMAGEVKLIELDA